MSKLTHFDESGAARMVDVLYKEQSARVAVASGAVEMEAITLQTIRDGKVSKGDVLGIARVAALQGLKRTAELIPLCHPVHVTGADIELEATDEGGRPRVRIRATVRAFDRTGVEMEALTAVSVAALTIYDMCKSMDRGMAIGSIQLDEKSGGKSGHWQR